MEVIKIPKRDRIRMLDQSILELPQGVRATDINNLDKEDRDVMLDLAIMEGEAEITMLDETQSTSYGD